MSEWASDKIEELRERVAQLESLTEQYATQLTFERAEVQALLAQNAALAEALTELVERRERVGSLHSQVFGDSERHRDGGDGRYARARVALANAADAARAFVERIRDEAYQRGCDDARRGPGLTEKEKEWARKAAASLPPKTTLEESARAEEREACARLFDDIHGTTWLCLDNGDEEAQRIAAAIRARGKP